ncbi:tetratricopeptide repeat protein [Histomonas meleagridis]|uniref:tetratricopeptide repeat protein n=1 Tax=Histomonas meleagridis TaxID=135588 RepID=UPI0035594F23|nr:tetratricopeptide repeat protein [Histomonas meleagridis]KAH0797474.1 tetratricopeptide repeat protein [Histomonas meleagridis]
MEFFLFLEDDPTDCCLFRITPTEPEPTFQNVIEKFLELYQKNHEISIEANKYSLFYDDLTYPLLNHKINKVEDLSKSVFSLKSNHFDLILSTTEPDTFYYEEEDAYEENNSTLQEFDEIISQGKTALANLDVSAVNRCILNAKTLIPNSPIPWHLQIRLLLKLHQYKLAIDAATTACHVYPSDSECLRLLAKSHQVAGLHQEAIEYYNRLILLSSRTLFDYDKINCSIAKSLLAIGAYDQALTLIQPIASSNPRNLKVTIVLGEILAKQGKLSEALHLVLRNFSVEPDHKRTRRFISEHVVNDLQIQILQSELGDGVIDSNILFYVGDMLNEFGSKYAAFHFLKLAFLISPNSPAIA